MADFTQNTNVKSAVPQTCGTHRGHQRVQRDCTVRYPEQPVRVVYRI